MATTMKGIIGGGGTTFSASPATKNDSFIMTAGIYHDVASDYSYVKSYTGFSTTVDNVRIGSITPSNIGTFKIMDVVDIYYTEMDEGGNVKYDIDYINITATHKCILHIKGTDYNITSYNPTNYKDSFWHLDDISKPISIKENEKIKVTYTLL